MTNEIIDFNLTESPAYYSSYSATTSGGVSFRWVDSPSKWTSIAAASCFTNALYGSATYSPGQTSYQGIGFPAAGTCFRLRGNTLAGQGNMFYYDGRLSR